MLTKLTIRNFKRFGEVEIELGNPVVFIGPNNSGKTSAMQALALWDVGLKRWNEKRSGKTTPEKRPGVTINRRDLIAVPVPGANLLWRDLHVREVRKDGGRQKTRNVRIDIIVQGVMEDRSWTCGWSSTMPMKSRSIAGHCDAPRKKTLNGCRSPRKPAGF